MSSRIDVISDSDIGGYIFEGTDDEVEDVGTSLVVLDVVVLDGLAVADAVLLLLLLPLPNRPPPLVILPQVE